MIGEGTWRNCRLPFGNLLHSCGIGGLFSWMIYAEQVETTNQSLIVYQWPARVVD